MNSRHSTQRTNDYPKFNAARFMQLQPNGGGTPDEIPQRESNQVYWLRRAAVLGTIVLLPVVAGLHLKSGSTEACVLTPGADTIDQNQRATAALLRQSGVEVFDYSGQLSNIDDSGAGQVVCLSSSDNLVGNALDRVFPPTGHGQ